MNNELKVWIATVNNYMSIMADRQFDNQIRDDSYSDYPHRALREAVEMIQEFAARIDVLQIQLQVEADRCPACQGQGAERPEGCGLCADTRKVLNA